MVVSERSVSIHELISAHKEERLLEAFGCSAPSFITPIKRIVYKNDTIEIQNAAQGKYYNYLNQLVAGIMLGPDTHPWVFPMADA